MSTQHIKSLAEAEKRVEKDEHIYLITILADIGIPASFIFTSIDDKPLWKIYFILQENVHPELSQFFDKNNCLAITNICKLT